jgi:FlaG/FlaF family flagellin (archaellin)
MVAITVILAAVIGTFVLGLGDQVSNTSPTASFTFDYDGTTLDVTHDGGDQLDAANIDIVPSSTSSTDWADATDGSTGTFGAGTTVSIDVGSGETVRVTWSSPNGGDSSTLGKWTGPDA